MNQNDLNRAVARATMEPVGAIAHLGFSLLSMPPTHPLAIPAQRRKYPLRTGPEARRRKPPRRQAKSFAKSATVVRSASKHPGVGTSFQPMPMMQLAFFDWGA